MRATEVLQKCLGSALRSMHALRRRVLLRAVEAMIHGRRLTLIDLARSWPGATRIRAPLKALDRLLGNSHLHAEREHIYKAMTRWLVRSKQPTIVIDWSDLKSDQKQRGQVHFPFGSVGLWGLPRGLMPAARAVSASICWRKLSLPHARCCWV
jgi:hypothetical protein